MIDRMRAAYRGAPILWNTALVVTIGVLLIALDTTGLWLAPGATELSRWWHLPPLLVAAGALLLQRRAPLRVLLAVTAIGAVDLVLGGSVGMLLLFFDALYSAVLRTTAARRRWLLIALAVATIGGTVATFVVSGGDLRGTVAAALLLGGVLSTPYAWAAAVREGRDRLEAEQQLAAAHREEVVREERAAMARDLHDTLAGELAAIAIHAEAGLAGGGREQAALRAVRASGVAGLEQVRAMIRVLRTEGAPLTAPGRLAQLPELVERAAGLAITVEGAPPALPVAVDQAAARILQESLTNAMKHAAGATVRIRFTEEDERMRLTIDSSSGTPSSVTGDGFGLAMMRERATALGGTLQAGPVDGGWRVEAVLPTGADG